MASNYPPPNNGFFIDTVGLYALDEQGTVAQQPAAVAESGGDQPAGNTQPAAPAAAVPTATPRADGAVVHVVQFGDSFWSLAVQYAATMDITPEEALTEIPALNNNPTVISAGDELIIVPPSPERATAVAEAAEGEAAEGEATPEAEEASAEEESGDSNEEGEPSEPSTEETTAEQGGSSNLSQALLQVSPSSICVQVYEDVNGDGARADVGELPVSDQAVTLRRGGTTVSTYVTDDSGDLYCFESLETDTYQVQVNPTADYVVVGDDRWAVAMAEGVMIPVSFGLQSAGDAVADAGTAEDAQDAEDSAAAASDEGGLTSNMGIVVLGIAVVLVLVAGAGVYLLRRG